MMNIYDRMNSQMTGRTQTSDYPVTYEPHKLCLKNQQQHQAPKKHMVCRLRNTRGRGLWVGGVGGEEASQHWRNGWF